MKITRFRYHNEPTVYHSADTGAPTGGGADTGTPPIAAHKPGEQRAGGDAKGDEDEDDEGKDDNPPKTGKFFTQSDLDRVVAQRLEDEKRREKARTERATREAVEKAARESGEWRTVAESRDRENLELKAEIERLNNEIESSRLTAIRERVAAKHKLPSELGELIRGNDESEMTAHAKTLARLVASPTAPNTELGRGGTGPQGLAPQKAVEDLTRGLAKTGRYSF